MRSLAVALALICFPAADVFAADSCALEGAQYRMMDFPAFSAGFRAVPWNPEYPRRIVFYIHTDQTDRTFWFLLDGGTGRYAYLISTTDVTQPGWIPPSDAGGSKGPLSRSMHYLSADADLHFSFEPPSAGDPAPLYILLPDLPEAMWYWVDPREGVPLRFFKLADCPAE
jgi:hypothetical protein